FIQAQQGEADELSWAVVQFYAHAPQHLVVDLDQPALAVVDLAPQLLDLLDEARALVLPLARRMPRDRARLTRPGESRQQERDQTDLNHRRLRHAADGSPSGRNKHAAGQAHQGHDGERLRQGPTPPGRPKTWP